MGWEFSLGLNLRVGSRQGQGWLRISKKEVPPLPPPFDALEAFPACYRNTWERTWRLTPWAESYILL